MKKIDKMSDRELRNELRYSRRKLEEMDVQNELLKLENRGMLILFETINRQTSQILEKIRRQGPSANRTVQQVQARYRTDADAAARLENIAEGSTCMGMRRLQKEGAE